MFSDFDKDEKNPNTLCRICLEDGATLPIFEADEKESIYLKLTKCLKEKIEDVQGYPRCICNNCKNTLDTIYNFINKYKESSKILEGGLLRIIKNEGDDEDDDHFNTDFEVSAIDFKIKTESIDYPEDDVIYVEPVEDFLKPFENLKNLTITKVKKENGKKNKNKVGKKRSLNKTNKIASSILEGEFLWNGEHWSLSSTKTPPPQVITVHKKRSHHKGAKKIVPLKKIPKEPKPDPPKLCDICGEVFKDSHRLTLHKKKTHFKNPAKCPKCPRICASQYYLNRHMKRKHDTNSDFICSICGHRFAFKGELSNHHRKVHDKHLQPKKIFKCKLCDKTYKCQKSVTVHERSAHTGQRPAICTVCDSSFYHEDYLKEHMRLHTGETPFKCPICGRGYAQRCNMKSHLRIHRVAEIPPDVLSKLRPNYLKLLKDFR